ncbi:gram-negative bacteria-binding protein 3-like [Calliphora vicina]|uniref:gram-negative bacteria-binding protein 3-like n=1 Tax=Calliphora vicina TaxID=7373 RepID=UPI00325BA45C
MVRPGNCVLLFVILLSVIPCYWTYVVPKAEIVVFYPKGFQVSIPHEKGITLFAFHGKLNEEMEGLEAGTWAHDILKHNHGRWTFRDRSTKLKLGDTLYYWTYVIYKGLGYREDDGVYVVRQYFNVTDIAVMDGPTVTTTTAMPNPNCLPTVTRVNGAPVRCSGQIIFEDKFKGLSLDSSKWTVERRIPQQPDYEFNMYLNDVAEVLQVHKGKLIITPKPTIQHYRKEVYNTSFSLGSSCTGKVDSDECVFQPRPHNKLNPLITAQIKTKDKFSFKYGKVAIKAKVPSAMWVYPQLWLEPSKLIYGGNLYHSGQMRVAHTIVNVDEIVLQGGLILNSNEPWRSVKMCQHHQTKLHLSQDFHLYELTWTPDVIAIAVDGEEYCRLEMKEEAQAFKNLAISDEFLPNRELLKEGSNWAPFDQEFYLTVGCGIGGNNDFKDEIEWKEPKPWTNTDPRSKNKFWKEYGSNLNWLNNGHFKVEFVKVYSV